MEDENLVITWNLKLPLLLLFQLFVFLCFCFLFVCLFVCLFTSVTTVIFLLYSIGYLYIITIAVVIVICMFFSNVKLNKILFQKNKKTNSDLVCLSIQVKAASQQHAGQGSCRYPWGPYTHCCTHTKTIALCSSKQSQLSNSATTHNTSIQCGQSAILKCVGQVGTTVRDDCCSGQQLLKMELNNSKLCSLLQANWKSHFVCVYTLANCLYLHHWTKINP